MLNILSAMVLGPRRRQEDCLLVLGETIQLKQMPEVRTWRTSAEGRPILLAVSDGLGGHDDGPWASRYVCERLAAVMPAAMTVAGVAAGVDALQQRMVADTEEESTGGAVLAGVLVQGERVLVFNVGDARVWRLAGDTPEPLTHDHSMVQELMDAGMITPEQARAHPHKGVVNLALGVSFARAWRAGKWRPLVRELTWGVGEPLLICSDGVHGSLEKHGGSLSDFFAGGPWEGAERLLAWLGDHAGDNASFILTWRES